jgi:hypothetical protein
MVHAADTGRVAMAARTKSKVTPKYKTKYRVENWPAYEESLRKRGDITFWFDDAAVDAWNTPKSGRPGGQLKYSHVAYAVVQERADVIVDGIGTPAAARRAINLPELRRISLPGP